MWPSFSLQCGVYALENSRHAPIEIEEIQHLNFPTIPNRQYDPNDVAKNVTIQERLRQFTNEPDKFDVLFESTSNYAKVEKQETTQLSLQ